MERSLKQYKSHPMRLLVGACAFFFILPADHSGFAQQSVTKSGVSVAQTVAASSQSGASLSAFASVPFTALGPAQVASSPAARSAEEEETAKPSRPGSEGIKVHGHWVLELKSAEGKLVERREFNNSLVTGGGSVSGDQILASLLSGVVTPGGMGIAFISGTTTGLDASSFCNVGDGGQVPVPSGISCFAFAAAGSALVSGADQTQFLSAQQGLSTSVSFSPSVNVVLSGNFVVQPSYNLTSISAVQTYVALCIPAASSLNAFHFSGTLTTVQSGNIAPSGCTNNVLNEAVAGGALTSTNIPGGPLAVTANQVITVTVTLSFS